MAQNEFAEFEEYAQTPPSNEFAEFEEYAQTPQSGPGMLDPRAGVPDSLAPPSYSLGEKFKGVLSAAAQGGTFGAAPYISAIADIGSDKPLGERFYEQRQAYADNRKAAPWASLAADTLAGIPAMAAASPFAMLGKASRMAPTVGPIVSKLGMFGANAVDSALQNAVRGSLDDGSLENTNEHAALGLAVGATLPLVGKALNRGYEGSKILGGEALRGIKSLRDSGLEWFGSTGLARTISNPDAIINKATSPLSATSKDIFNKIADVIGVDNLGTNAAKITPEQKTSAVNAFVQQTGAAPDAAAQLVDQAVASGAESGATLGGVLRLMVKDDTAAVSKRFNTAYDAWSPLATDLDPRATQARRLTGSLREAFENNELNRALGKGELTERAYDVGRMNKPGYATDADFAAHGDAPINLRAGDPREARIAANGGYWNKLPDAPPLDQVPSTDLGLRPFTAETATQEDLYKMMQSGTDFPFPLDEKQLGKLTDLDAMESQFGRIGGDYGAYRPSTLKSGTQNLNAGLGQSTGTNAGFAPGGGDDAATGVFRTQPELPQTDSTTFGVEPGSSLIPDAPAPQPIQAPLPDAPPEPSLFGFQPAPAPVKPDMTAARSNNRDIGRSALNRMSLLAPSLGFGLGGFPGAALGSAAAVGSNLAIDIGGAFGGQLAASGRRALTPAALASSWLENPSVLQSVAQRQDPMGRSAAWALKGLQESGADGLKSRAFILAMDPQIRAYFDKQED